MLPPCTGEARYLLQAGKNQAMSPGVSYRQGSAVRFHAMFPQGMDLFCSPPKFSCDLFMAVADCSFSTNLKESFQPAHGFSDLG